jgi:predicted TIM-barrel fold metal-dependent hydrolase
MVSLGNVGEANPSEADVRTINTNTLNAMARKPDLFIGFCYLNPALPETFLLEEIERCVIRGRMRGIKLWIAVKATDPRLDPIMTRAQALDIPVLHHAWYKRVAGLPNESTPAEVAALARRFPKVTVVMAHLTGVGARGVMDVADCPNLLVDTSGGQPEAGWVEYAVQRLGGERVAYGSDWPIRDFGVQIGRIMGARLTDRERGLILRGNAARILKEAV